MRTTRQFAVRTTVQVAIPKSSVVLPLINCRDSVEKTKSTAPLPAQWRERYWGAASSPFSMLTCTENYSKYPDFWQLLHFLCMYVVFCDDAEHWTKIRGVCSKFNGSLISSTPMFNSYSQRLTLQSWCRKKKTKQRKALGFILWDPYMCVKVQAAVSRNSLRLWVNLWQSRIHSLGTVVICSKFDSIPNQEQFLQTL